MSAWHFLERHPEPLRLPQDRHGPCRRQGAPPTSLTRHAVGTPALALGVLIAAEEREDGPAVVALRRLHELRVAADLLLLPAHGGGGGGDSARPLPRGRRSSAHSRRPLRQRRDRLRKAPGGSRRAPGRLLSLPPSFFSPLRQRPGSALAGASRDAVREGTGREQPRALGGCREAAPIFSPRLLGLVPFLFTSDPGWLLRV